MGGGGKKCAPQPGEMVAYSYDPFVRSGRSVSGQVTPLCISHGLPDFTDERERKKRVRGAVGWEKIGGGGRAYRCVRFDGAIERHWCTALLCDLGILAMESALLVLLHACNLLLQSTRIFHFYF